ncbi:MAG: hypothetical protein GKR92_00505 [Gammaproteobacteria bacterium]|nr:MAG: hypothetical protein GKR92_00505 [Gammaproteobacteria bacterium]
MLLIKLKITILILSAYIVLNGCVISNVTKDTEDPELKLRAPLDGIWIGEFDIRGKGPYDFTAVHLQDKAYAFSLNAKAMCVGTLEFDGKHVLNKYVLFALDGGPFDWANLTGTFEDDGENPKTISTYFKTLSGGDTGALKVAYSELYDKSSSLEYLKGNWSYTDRDQLTSTIFIDEEGVLTGHDSDGCEYLGYLDLINPRYNVYRAKLEVIECGSVNDEYEGVAFINENTLAVQIANKKYALFYAFEKK